MATASTAKPFTIGSHSTSRRPRKLTEANAAVSYLLSGAPESAPPPVPPTTHAAASAGWAFDNPLPYAVRRQQSPAHA